MISRLILIIGIMFTGSVASAADQCPVLNASNRDQVLNRFFQEVKPDPMDPKTGPRQDAIFSCLEKLIEGKSKKLGRRAPDFETMKRLVLWTTKSYQYRNDEYSSDFSSELGQKIFQPNAKLTKAALEKLLEEKVLTKEDAEDFKQGVELN